MSGTETTGVDLDTIREIIEDGRSTKTITVDLKVTPEGKPEIPAGTIEVVYVPSLYTPAMENQQNMSSSGGGTGMGFCLQTCCDMVQSWTLSVGKTPKGEPNYVELTREAIMKDLNRFPEFIVQIAMAIIEDMRESNPKGRKRGSRRS